MSGKVRLFSWNPGSEGCKALSLASGIARLKHVGSKFRHGNDKVVINWGASSFKEAAVFRSKVINHPDAVVNVTNKLRFFQMLEDKGEFTPKFTTSKDVAVGWLGEGHVVFARQVLNGSGGKGIKVMEPANLETWVQAPLYTQYVKKKDEYRIHVMNGEVFLTQRKGLRKTDDNGQAVDPKGANWMIRNLENGFIFVRQNVQPPEAVLKVATDIFPHLGLDFYAADIVYNESAKKAYVLEVNTAPGLDGSTVGDYAAAFKKHFDVP